MAKKKILLKEVYEKLLSDANAEKNDKLLPILAYDNEVVEKIEKLITIDAQDYEVAIDSENSKNYYDTYLRIFYGIIKCENEEDLGKWKDSIIENNPWKKALENSEQFRSIADSDYKIMEVLITKESEGFIKNLLDNNLFKTGIETINENDEFRKMIADELAIPFFEKLFSRFEHAFDGNFEDPRVIILGINPRLQNISHADFGLKNIYKNIFDYKCPSYVREENHEIYKYYFRNGGFFFGALGKNKKDKEKNKIMIKLREDFMNSLEMKFPYALYEFFPYATDSENNWYINIKINNGKKYLALEKLLPSQIWMLCLLTYTLKKAIFSGRTMYLFLTKNNEEFKKGFFDKYLELLNISNKTNIKILTKNNNQNRNFRWNNIKEYKKKKMNFASVEEFFKIIWGIPLFKLKRKRKRAKCRKLIRKRIVKSRKV